MDVIKENRATRPDFYCFPTSAAVGGGENLATQHEKEFVTEWIGPHSLFTPFVLLDFSTLCVFSL